jgi:hypothetical protein
MTNQSPISNTDQTAESTLKKPGLIIPWRELPW